MPLHTLRATALGTSVSRSTHRVKSYSLTLSERPVPVDPRRQCALLYSRPMIPSFLCTRKKKRKKKTAALDGREEDRVCKRAGRWKGGAIGSPTWWTKPIAELRARVTGRAHASLCERLYKFRSRDIPAAPVLENLWALISQRRKAISATPLHSSSGLALTSTKQYNNPEFKAVHGGKLSAAGDISEGAMPRGRFTPAKRKTVRNRDFGVM